jgi:hypothetical protein
VIEWEASERKRAEVKDRGKRVHLIGVTLAHIVSMVLVKVGSALLLCSGAKPDEDIPTGVNVLVSHTNALILTLIAP